MSTSRHRLGIALAVMFAATPATVEASTNTLAGCPMFPADSPWNTRVDAAPVDARSDEYIRSSGADRNLSTAFRRQRGWGIPINVVGRSQPTARLPKVDQWIAPGRYPIPRAPRIQPASDAHMLILQRGTCKLYELYGAHRVNGRWRALQATIWDTKKNQVLPPNVVSAVAAGTPMAAGLLNVRDARRSEITHALNFTLPYIQRGWVYPASHTDGAMADPGFLPMGARIRLKASVRIEHLPRQARIVATTMKRYGMILTDTSGRPDGDQYDGFEIQGADSRHWNERARRALYSLHLRDFEVVEHAGPIRHLDYTQIRHRRMLPDVPPWTTAGATTSETAERSVGAHPDGLVPVIPHWYRLGMTTQIAVRLPDELVRYVDAQVAEGAASSRADLIARVLAREERRQRALADIERMRRAGMAGYPELDGARQATRQRSVDLD